MVPKPGVARLMDIKQESDVGMGVVYEQFRMNLLLERIIKKYRIKTVLESPIYGMAGLTGINSIALADLGLQVTLADQERYIEKAKMAWKVAKRKAEFVVNEKTHWPFNDQEFDLSYNFAALWHTEHPEKIVDEMTRVSKIVLICMPNRWNPLHQMRRLFGALPKKHHWADEKKVTYSLKKNGYEIVETGLVDIPPWPDTEISIKEFLSKFRLSKGKSWRWSMLDYYMGKKEIKKKVEKYYFIEDSRLPKIIKKCWSHHFYVLAKRVK